MGDKISQQKEKWGNNLTKSLPRQNSVWAPCCSRNILRKQHRNGGGVAMTHTTTLAIVGKPALLGISQRRRLWSALGYMHQRRHYLSVMARDAVSVTPQQGCLPAHSQYTSNFCNLSFKSMRTLPPNLTSEHYTQSECQQELCKSPSLLMWFIKAPSSP